MKIVACIKQVSVLGDEVEFVDDESTVDPDFLDTALNEWDGYAVEQALRLRELSGGDDDEVIVVSVGDDAANESIRRCLAMGADTAIRIDNQPSADPLSIARALAKVISNVSPDLIICGTQSADSAQSAVPSALAEFLGLPVACMVIGIDSSEASGGLVVRRELEGGRIEVVEVDTPAVVTMQTGSNEPRYATLRQIKQAKKKPISEVDGGLGDASPGYRVRRMYVPPKSGNTIFLDGDVQQIAAKLKDVIEGAAK